MDLTGGNQRGFKKYHSTATVGLKIQSLLARSLENNINAMLAMLAGLDLISAFDGVNVRLLIKRLHIIGLPNDICRQPSDKPRCLMLRILDLVSLACLALLVSGKVFGSEVLT